MPKSKPPRKRRSRPKQHRATVLAYLPVLTDPKRFVCLRLPHTMESKHVRRALADDGALDADAPRGLTCCVECRAAVIIDLADDDRPLNLVFNDANCHATMIRADGLSLGMAPLCKVCGPKVYPSTMIDKANALLPGGAEYTPCSASTTESPDA